MKDKLILTACGVACFSTGLLGYFFLLLTMDLLIFVILMMTGLILISNGLYLWRQKKPDSLTHVTPKGLIIWNFFFILIFMSTFSVLSVNLTLIPHILLLFLIYFVVFMIIALVSYPYREKVQIKIDKRLAIGLVGVGLLIISPFLNWISVTYTGILVEPLQLDFLGFHNLGPIETFFTLMGVDLLIGVLLMFIVFGVALTSLTVLMDPKYKENPKEMGKSFTKKAIILIIFVVIIVIQASIMFPMLASMPSPLDFSKLQIVPGLGLIIVCIGVALLLVSGTLLKKQATISPEPEVLG